MFDVLTNAKSLSEKTFADNSLLALVEVSDA